MAFLYPDRKPEELSDIEIVQDVLLTQNKIEADLRDTLALVKEENFGKRILGFYSVSLNGSALMETFIKACFSVFIDRNKDLINIDGDMEHAWIKYEHFQFPPISDCIVGKLSDNNSW